MDHLRICMNALRSSASDAERVHLGERWIKRYCQEEVGNRKLVLRRLLNAIHKEAQQYPSEDLWITMQAYVQSLLLSWSLRSRCRHPKNDDHQTVIRWRTRGLRAGKARPHQARPPEGQRVPLSGGRSMSQDIPGTGPSALRHSGV